MLQAIHRPLEPGTEAKVQKQQQTVIWKLGELALIAEDLEQIIQEAASAITSTLDTEFSAVFELLPDGANIELSAGAGWKKDYVGRTVLLVDKETQEGSTLLSEKPLIVENYFTDKRFIAPALLREHEIRSGMTVIIRSANARFGVLGSYSTRIRQFNEDDIHFLQSIANILSEVIARREIEDALGMSEEKYRVLFEESKDAIFVSTPEGELIDINPAGMELFEYKSKEEMLQVNIQLELFLENEDRRRYELQLLQEGTVKDFQLKMKTRTGRILFVENTSTAVRDAKGRVVAYRGIIRDVTNIRRLQQQLMNAQRSENLEPLAIHLAYDFMNIFTTIFAYCELMRLKVPDNLLFNEYLRQMEQAVQKGTALTRELFSFSKKQNPDREST